MPELSRFFGIIVRMFAEAGGQHHVAYFHAYWQDQVAVISIDPVDVIAGSLPQAATASGGSVGRATSARVVR